MRSVRILTIVFLAGMLRRECLAQAAGGATDDVSAQLADVVGRFDVPGMVAAVIEGDRVVAAGAAGVRSRGGRERVTLADQFHIGSCTKAMTATVCAMLVEE